MGGPGSGNRDRWGAKPSTAACNRFDLASLHRGGWLHPGAVGTTTWSRGGTETSSIGWAVLGEEGAAALELRYAVGGEAIRYAVPLAWTPCRFGGRRRGAGGGWGSSTAAASSSVGTAMASPTRARARARAIGRCVGPGGSGGGWGARRTC